MTIPIFVVSSREDAIGIVIVVVDKFVVMDVVSDLKNLVEVPVDSNGNAAVDPV